ncbi:hypothetical protein [Flavobacterium lacisediminis]|uniref:Uncharacterized protein n=1 Tax=Flavobacterium lacisediminis TaxID=2989705 RepID=A0ABT3EJS2_9FLAO|nr:hypothetical protein [Flavobacterium lacisediminis]MCW1148828.1 hypothetical protein [Flavobacterium lacisediminis]
MDNFREATIISKYLLDVSIGDTEMEKYHLAMEHLKIELAKEEALLWRFMLKSRLVMLFIDSYLSFFLPQSAIRRKLFIMLAILETTPLYAAYFLPKERNLFFLIKILFLGFVSFFYVFIGFFMVKIIRLLWN